MHLIAMPLGGGLAVVGHQQRRRSDALGEHREERRLLAELAKEELLHVEGLVVEIGEAHEERDRAGAADEARRFRIEEEHAPRVHAGQLGVEGEDAVNVFAGVKSAYEPNQLVGRLVVMVANLAPRKMKFGVSEGMVLASGPGGKEIYLLSPDAGAKPGQRLH